jgi:hypothetical protein
MLLNFGIFRKWIPTYKLRLVAQPPQPLKLRRGAACALAHRDRALDSGIPAGQL